MERRFRRRPGGLGLEIIFGPSADAVDDSGQFALFDAAKLGGFAPAPEDG
jgi:hypothetical protein